MTKIADNAGILDGVERKRHPGERRDRLQHLDERIERLVDQGRHADQEAERDRDDHREQIAQSHARDGIAELDAEALVVRPVVVERPLEVLPQFGADIERARHRRLALRRRQPHQLGVFRRLSATAPCRAWRDARCRGTPQTARSKRSAARKRREKVIGDSLDLSSRANAGTHRRGVSREEGPLTPCSTKDGTAYAILLSQRGEAKMSAVAPHDAFLILKLFEIFLGLGRIERLAHHRKTLGGGRRRRQPGIPSSALRGIGGEIDLLGHAGCSRRRP